jgi:hypothetical protein
VHALSDWVEFALIIGGATASLLGLLFVAVSIRIEVITRSTELRVRAAQTLSLLLTGLLGSVLLTIPAQARWALGVELVLLALGATGTSVVLDLRARREHEGNRIAHILHLATPNVSTCLLLAAAGVTLLYGSQDGLYLLVPAFLAVLAGAVVNAWLILVIATD